MVRSTNQKERESDLTDLDPFSAGLRQQALFRMAGDFRRIDELQTAFNMPPSWGDRVELDNEPIENVAGLFKRYLRDMSEPVMEPQLFRLFLNSCILTDKALRLRIFAAQTTLRLLASANFSLLIYLIAFLGQLAEHHHQNGLTNESISIILGPALLAPRTAGSAAGLIFGSPEISQSRKSGEPMINKDVQHSQLGLKWLLEHCAGRGDGAPSCISGRLGGPSGSTNGKDRGGAIFSH